MDGQYFDYRDNRDLKFPVIIILSKYCHIMVTKIMIVVA